MEESPTSHKILYKQSTINKEIILIYINGNKLESETGQSLRKK